MEHVKLHELIKSNEYSSYAILQAIETSSELYIASQETITYKIGILIVSALMTGSIGEEAVGKIACAFNVQNNFVMSVAFLFALPIIFSILYFILKYFITIVKRILNKLRNNDKSFENRENLLNLFYKNILNEITLAFSFEKRAQLEFINPSDKSFGSKKNAETSNQLANIYFIEAQMYFRSAYKKLIDNSIVELYNENDVDSIALINELSPLLLLDLFSLCMNALTRICSHLYPNIDTQNLINIEGKSFTASQQCLIDLIIGYRNLYHNLSKYKDAA